MRISDWSSDVCSSDLNLKIVLIALFGAVAGQAVIGFAAHLYPLFYLERVAKVDGATANFLVATALLLIIPSFVFFGWLSARIGRKPIMMTACVIAVFVYFPAYKALVRSEARRVGTECVSTCGYRWSPYH